MIQNCNEVTSNSNDEGGVELVVQEKDRLMAPLWRYGISGLRHNHLLMRPVAFIMLTLLSIYWVLSTILSLPTMILGFFLSPIMKRGYYFIEFLYPTAIARIGHIMLISFAEKQRGPVSAPTSTNNSTGNSKQQSSANNNNGLCMINDDFPDKNRGYHSRTIEQRIEVIPGRVYIHPIAQFLDNLGYLVVCCPPVKTKKGQKPGTTTLMHKVFGKLKVPIPIVAFVVDCGDADAVFTQLQYIRKFHYADQNIHLVSIMSTHKHHDHTAGNGNLKNHPGVKTTFKHIFGAAVENVPYCNYEVADGDKLPLPEVPENNMNDVIEVEALIMPSHTRGSTVYALRTKQLEHNQKPFVFLFTGDSMFSGGAGVPFEAGTDPLQDKGLYDYKKHSSLRPGVGNHAIEQCFAEILFRGLSSKQRQQCKQYGAGHNKAHQYIIFPGHEYTAELLGRQFLKESVDSYKWQNLPPNIYFETLSQLYVSLHRRALPYGSGKLLSALPTTMEREMMINPHMRSLKARGEIVIHAINLWYEYFSKTKDKLDDIYNNEEENGIEMQQPLPREHDHEDSGIEIEVLDKTTEESKMTSIKDETNAREMRNNDNNDTAASNSKISYDKVPVTKQSWNVSVHDIVGKNNSKQSVFTTVYSDDINNLINDLNRGHVTNNEDIVRRLKNLKSKVNSAPVRRRPVPGTLPSDRNIYRGLIGLVILGSPPTALTLADSRQLNIPPPIIPNITNTDKILISKARLIAVLTRLGLLSYHTTLTAAMSEEEESDADHSEYSSRKNHLITMIDLLWQESSDYAALMGGDDRPGTTTRNYHNSYDSVDIEDNKKTENDLIELGVLKWMLYGLAAKQPSWFSRFCMSCGSGGKKNSSKHSNKPKKGKHLSSKRQYAMNSYDSSSPPASVSSSEESLQSYEQAKHPSEFLNMRKHGGELVRHDILTCLLCRDSTGFEAPQFQCYRI